MKLLFAFILLFSSTCFSQNLVVHYTQTSINKNKDVPSEKHILIFKDGISYFTKESVNKDLPNLDLPNLDLLPEDAKKHVLADIKKYTKDKYYYKNSIDNKLLTIIGGQQVVDSVFDWNWEITDEVKTIQGLECRKAVSNFMGFPFVAWYTTEVPISAGPEFYHGLPGLILHAYNLGFEYQADLIEFPKSLADIEEPELYGSTRVTFMEAQRNLLTPSQSKTEFLFSPNANTIKSSIIQRIKKN